MIEVERMCDWLEVASLQCLNETHQPTKEVGKSCSGKTEEINEQVQKDRET